MLIFYCIQLLHVWILTFLIFTLIIYIYEIILVPCWIGDQLFFRFLRLPSHFPLAFQSDPFDFSQKEKDFKPKSS